ncbi:MAG: hypothetical protein J6N72_05955, partial [Psychrobacter sp.]|nr:hypothetical protein [Psychrobacter sp.]
MIRYDKTNHEGMLSKSESKTEWGLVVVLGHILNINGTLYDLRMPESIYQIDSYPTNRKNTDINTNTPEGQMAWHINDMLEGWLPYEENWGDNETQWDLAINNAADLTLDSDWAAPLDDYNEALRAMAALAGKEPLKLCRDNEPWVRGNCVQSLINDKKRGVVRDDTFLDTLIKHEDDPQVLAKIAEYGLVKHLDRLLPNASLEVMRQIAKHKIARHILAMSSHSDPLIRLLSVSYIDTTVALEEIAAANQDSAEILEAVEDRMHII